MFSLQFNITRKELSGEEFLGNRFLEYLNGRCCEDRISVGCVQIESLAGEISCWYQLLVSDVPLLSLFSRTMAFRLDFFTEFAISVKRVQWNTALQNLYQSLCELYATRRPNSRFFENR